MFKLGRRVLVGIASVSVLGLSGATHAAPIGGFGFTVEPIIGFDRVQKLVPNPHTKNRLIYGARATAGILLISAEGEYTRGQDDESYSDLDLTVKEQADKAKLGIRSGFKLGPVVTFNLRAGGQATKGKRDETRGGVTTTYSQDLEVDPYAGAGLRGRLSNKLSASAEVVAVVTDTSDLSKNEYQTTAGFSIHLP
jgi:hypothetical protein